MLLSPEAVSETGCKIGASEQSSIVCVVNMILVSGGKVKSEG